MMDKPVGPVGFLLLYVLSSDDRENELLRCTKGGLNVFFLLNYLRRVRFTVSITVLCVENTRISGIFQTRGSSFTLPRACWSSRPLKDEGKTGISQENDPPCGRPGFSPEGRTP